jgi:hypothetical protein
MRETTRYGLCGIVLVLCLAGCPLLLFHWVYEGPCVRTRPLAFVRGEITTVHGIFTSETAYWLWYEGAYAESGNECETKVRVTKEEFERKAYNKGVR